MIENQRTSTSESRVTSGSTLHECAAWLLKATLPSKERKDIAVLASKPSAFVLVVIGNLQCERRQYRKVAPEDGFCRQ